MENRVILVEECLKCDQTNPICMNSIETNDFESDEKIQLSIKPSENNLETSKRENEKSESNLIKKAKTELRVILKFFTCLKKNIFNIKS